VRDAVERQEVVLAQRHHLDVAYEHQFLVVCLERGREHLRRVDPQSGEQFRVRASDPCGRSPQPIPVGVLTDRDEDLAYRSLDAGEVDGLGDVVAAESAVDQPGGEMVEPGVELVAAGLGATLVRQ
jgi:hypothetical protein